MNSESSYEQMTEGELQRLLQDYYVPVAIPEGFQQSLFAELEQ